MSRQLEELCKRNEFFKPCLLKDLLTADYKNGKLTFHHDPKHPNNGVGFCRVPLAGFEFVPLIHREYYLACQVDVIWLRRKAPGDIVHGGDLDNRLKTLIDGLRMPHEETEVGRSPPSAPGERVYCLLDDDGLITKLSVSTHQLLEPVAPDSDDIRGTDVDLIIQVTVQVTSRRIGNTGVGELV
jgi:hypothetical protein